MSQQKKPATDKLSFDGFKVVSVIPRTQDQLDFLKNMASRPNTTHNVEFWSQPSELNRQCDLMIPPASFNTMTSTLTSNGFRWNISIGNVESEVDSILNFGRKAPLQLQHSSSVSETGMAFNDSSNGNNNNRNSPASSSTSKNSVTFRRGNSTSPAVNYY